jgi:hypothetical protein
MFRFATILVLLIVSAGLEAAADARLVGQQVRGARRSCIYENRGPNRARVPYRETGVGAGEPCPSRYRAERPRQAATAPIPPMATLSPPRPGFTRYAPANGRRQCVYTYLGVDYVRTISETQQCPLTPLFLPQ